MYKGQILGAATTTAGAVMLPNTSGNSWFLVTAAVIMAAGIALLSFRAYTIYVKRSK